LEEDSGDGGGELESASIWIKALVAESTSVDQLATSGTTDRWGGELNRLVSGMRFLAGDIVGLRQRRVSFGGDSSR